MNELQREIAIETELDPDSSRLATGIIISRNLSLGRNPSRRRSSGDTPGSRRHVINGLNIPAGSPLVYEIDDVMHPLHHYYYLGDEEGIRQVITSVAN